MSDVQEILHRAQEFGAKFWVDGDRVKVKAPSPLPIDLMDKLRVQKTAVRCYLEAESRKTSLLDLPFPISYGGLPVAQVEMAESWLKKIGITDPVLCKYNVVSWVRGYYQNRGENHGEHYEAIKLEQQRLGRILDGGDGS